MNASKKPMAAVWRDPDDAPDLSAPAWQEKFAKVPVKRGRPKSAVTKVSTTIRLDAEVVAALKKAGPGWQTRANDILRTELLPKKKQARHA